MGGATARIASVVLGLIVLPHEARSGKPGIDQVALVIGVCASAYDVVGSGWMVGEVGLEPTKA